MGRLRMATADEMHQFFRIARNDARCVLQRLDARFEPRVYFAAFEAEAGGSRGVFADPDCPFPDDALNPVPDRAAALDSADPENGSYQTDPVQQSIKRKNIRNRAWRQALTEAIRALDESEGFVTYCGWPVSYWNYLLMPILQLPEAVHNSYYHLKNEWYYDRELPPGETDPGTRHRYRLNRSLIEAAVMEYFVETGKVLENGQPGPGVHSVSDVDQLLLSASRDMMLPAAVAGRNPLGLHGVFDACNTISTLRYEGKEGVGRMLFAKRKHADIETAVTLKNPVYLRSFGAIRKLLQMASKDLSLLCDSEAVYGLGHVRPTYQLDGESIFTVQFSRQFSWDLLHGPNHLMHVKYGQAAIRPPTFPIEKFRRDLPRVFSGIQPDAIERLCNLARSAAAQKHGCMLVISPKAVGEAERLRAQSTPVEPFELSETVMDLVTAIDGSVLVDPNGTCHAIGVILDGLADDACTPERGARYNSAVRYHAKHRDAIVVVKSEDGMVSTFPDLRPQVAKSEIVARVNALANELNLESPSPENLRDAVRRLREVRFYLTAKACGVVNELLAKVEKVYEKHDWITGLDEKFVPDPQMDESYYLPE